MIVMKKRIYDEIDFEIVEKNYFYKIKLSQNY